MKRWPWVCTALVAPLALGLAFEASADAPPAPDATPAVCREPPRTRAPDPRCGETLDGRPPFEPKPGLFAPFVLFPRLLIRIALWPVVKVSDLVESKQLDDRMNALLTSDDGCVGVRPVLRYSTGFLPTLGARGFYRRLPGRITQNLVGADCPGSELAARVGVGDTSTLFAELAFHGPAWWGGRGRFAWARRPDFLYAGIGPRTNDELAAAGQGEGRYAAEGWQADLSWVEPLPWWLSLEMGSNLVWRDYSSEKVRGGPSVAAFFGLLPDACAARGLDPGCVDEAAVPGFNEGLRLVRAVSELRLDLRDSSRDASGVEIALAAKFSEGIAGDPSRHLRLDGVALAALGGVDRAVLMRLFAGTTAALGSAPIPFEELVSPAGLAGMRGFPHGRFRDRSGLGGSAEYRWFIASRLDAALFVDVGTVAGAGFSNLSASRLFPSFGLGIRRYPLAPAYWRTEATGGVQLAYAPEGGFQLLLSLAGF